MYLETSSCFNSEEALMTISWFPCETQSDNGNTVFGAIKAVIETRQTLLGPRERKVTGVPLSTPVVCQIRY